MVRDISIKNVEVEEEIQDIEDNLQRLIDGVLDLSIDDLPNPYQRHTIGVSRCFGRLLHRVARFVMFYHEHKD